MISHFLATILALSVCQFATAESKMRDVTTHEALSQQLRAQQQADPILTLKPAEGDDPTKTNPTPDLIASSQFLCYNGMATLVPMGAVLCAPEKLKSRMRFTQGARIVTWAEFYSMNRAWLSTVAVSLDQATGKLPLSDEMIKKVKNDTHILVSTCQNGPISIVPFKTAAEAQTPPR